MRRIGVLMNFGAADTEGQSRVAGFVKTLSELGWTDGRRSLTVRIERLNAQLILQLLELAAQSRLGNTDTHAVQLP